MEQYNSVIIVDTAQEHLNYKNLYHGFQFRMIMSA